MDKGFEVTCDNGKPYLSSISLELSEGFYYPSYTIGVKFPEVSLNSTVTRGIDLSGSPCSFSTMKNSFISVGCDSYGSGNQNNLNTTACQSFCTCDPNQNVAGCCDFCLHGGPRMAAVKLPNKSICFERFQGCTGDLICNTKSGYNCSAKCPSGYTSYSYDSQDTRCYSSRSFTDILIKKSRVKLFTIVGCCAGLGTLLLVIGIWWLYKLIKRRKAIKLKQKFFKRNGGLLLQQQLSSNEVNIEKTRLFTSKELVKAIDNYNANRILGQGGQGTVYKGMLADGKIVVTYFLRAMEENSLFKILDARVLKEGEKEQIMSVANVRRRCLNLNGKKRPTMREVAFELVVNIRASNGASVLQQNYDEIDFVDNEITCPGSSLSSTGSFLNSVTLDVDPLISKKC
ncbi:hypothetical protein Pint_21503 [Pistacia integerrima]|uniref:Uncharacterized protein n=1 Tax=Pistacia integerrima TaxID=434235 RepID=A0ACC0XE67_9ROSI|nr:hypothetical protein Pint_21503 [Pistacia integerrima]